MAYLFDILDYGAQSDGTTLNTGAIQAAIDACHESGGGCVICGPGRWLTGSIELKSNVELRLLPGCTLLGSPRVEDYVDFDAPGFRQEFSPEKNSKSLIRAIHAHNIAITGQGAVDGSGVAFYDTKNLTGPFFGKPPTARPRLVMCYGCTDLRFEDSAYLDSPCWTFWLMKCERVTIRGLRVLGDQRMINNDGIDIDSCRDVTISDCLIRTADDCLILRAINQCFDEPAPCENISITNCVLDSWCQGVRIGCPGDGTIRNATFSNLVIHGRQGILFEFPKRYLRDGQQGSADVHDILFTNVSVESQGSPLKVAVEDGISLTRVSDLSFSDLRLRCGLPVMLKGSPETILRDIRLSNVAVDCAGDNAFDLRWCEGVKLDGVEVTRAGKR